MVLYGTVRYRNEAGRRFICAMCYAKNGRNATGNNFVTTSNNFMFTDLAYLTELYRHKC